MNGIVGLGGCGIIHNGEVSLFLYFLFSVLFLFFFCSFLFLNCVFYVHMEYAEDGYIECLF